MIFKWLLYNKTSNAQHFSLSDENEALRDTLLYIGRDRDRINDALRFERSKIRAVERLLAKKEGCLDERDEV